MHEGTDLRDVAARLQKIAETKQDYLAPMGKVEFGAAEQGNAALAMDGGSYPLTPWAFNQVNTYLNIPGQYAKRTLDSHPELWAKQANTWAADHTSDTRMVRTLDGQARGFLSDAYRPLDGYDLATAALPALADVGAKVRSSQITDTKLYIKATIPELEALVPGSKQRNDVVRGGVCLGTSEVGNGAVFIRFFIERLVCINGMIAESVLRKTHLGRRTLKELENATQYFTDRTRKLDDAAFWSKFNDVLRATITQENMDMVVAKFQAATEDPIENLMEPQKVIEATVQKLNLPSSTQPGILKNLIEAGDLTRWGLTNAVTALANEMQDYEVASTLEEAGGKIIDLTKQDWKTISAGAVRQTRQAALAA